MHVTGGPQITAAAINKALAAGDYACGVVPTGAGPQRVPVHEAREHLGVLWGRIGAGSVWYPIGRPEVWTGREARQIAAAYREERAFKEAVWAPHSVTP